MIFAIMAESHQFISWQSSLSVCHCERGMTFQRDSPKPNNTYFWIVSFFYTQHTHLKKTTDYSTTNNTKNIDTTVSKAKRHAKDLFIKTPSQLYASITLTDLIISSRFSNFNCEQPFLGKSFVYFLWTPLNCDRRCANIFV